MNKKTVMHVVIPLCNRCGEDRCSLGVGNLNGLCPWCLKETEGMECQAKDCASPGYNHPDRKDESFCKYHWYWLHDFKKCEAGTCDHPRK